MGIYIYIYIYIYIKTKQNTPPHTHKKKKKNQILLIHQSTSSCKAGCLGVGCTCARM